MKTCEIVEILFLGVRESIRFDLAYHYHFESVFGHAYVFCVVCHHQKGEIVSFEVDLK